MMTRIEKEMVITALSYYAKRCKSAEQRERKRGELGRAAKLSADKCIAEGLVSEFCRVLTEPCGTCSI